MASDFWSHFEAALAAATLAGGAVAFLSKLLVKHFLDTEVKRDLEKIKADLGRLGAEHRVRFTLLHTERAKILADLFSHLRRAYDHTYVFSLGALKTSVDHKANSGTAAFDAIHEAQQLISYRSVWLSEDLAQISQRLLDEITGPSFQFHYYTKQKMSEKDVLDSIDRWITHKDETRRLMTEVESAFRAELIGATV